MSSPPAAHAVRGGAAADMGECPGAGPPERAPQQPGGPSHAGPEGGPQFTQPDRRQAAACSAQLGATVTPSCGPQTWRRCSQPSALRGGFRMTAMRRRQAPAPAGPGAWAAQPPHLCWPPPQAPRWPRAQASRSRRPALLVPRGAPAALTYKRFSAAGGAPSPPVVFPEASASLRAPFRKPQSLCFSGA